MQLEVGTIIEGKVTGISKFGAFVELPNGKTGMIHISEISSSFVRDIKDYLQENQIVKAKVINISEKNEVALSIKKLSSEKNTTTPNKPFDKKNLSNISGKPANFGRPNTKKSAGTSFEDMLSSFKHASEEKISDLRRARDSKRSSSSRRGAQR